MQDAKMTQKSPSVHHCTTLSSCIFATKACIDNRKNLLNSNMSLTCAHNMANFGPLTLRPVREFGAPQQISTGFAFAFVTAATSLTGGQPNFARCLTVSWAATLHIHFRAFLPSNGILPEVHFASKSCTLLYLQRHCTAL